MPEHRLKFHDQLLDAVLNHVVFDGWSEASFDAGISDSGLDRELAWALFPRGALDLAVAYHKRGDQKMCASLAEADLSALRFRDRVAQAVKFRFNAIEDKEAVRRGATLFALPQYAAEGAKLIWGTSDAIWIALGDTSEDANWYTKRATLSGVYSSTVIYWLGDDSEDYQATWEFLDRRIENVMQFEIFKAKVQENPLFKPFLAGPNWLASQLRKPSQTEGLPGRWSTHRKTYQDET